jgi:hypothetical protein
MIARVLVAPALLLVLVAGCDSGSGPAPNVGGVNVPPTTGATVTPSTGNSKAPSGATSSTRRQLVPDPK